MVAKPRQTSRSKKSVPRTLTLRGRKLEDFLPLLPAETKLRTCAASGEDCIVDGFSGSFPKKAGTRNTIRSEFLRYMILGGCEKSPVARRGIWVEGAYVKCSDSNGLDLEAESVSIDIALENCQINGSINLLKASCKLLSFEGSHIVGIDGDGLETFGDVHLSGGFHASDEVSLFGSRIGGELFCDDGTFGGELELGNATIAQNLELSGGFSSETTVSLRGVKIGGNLNCEGASFDDPDNAIIANRAKIDGDVNLAKVKARGTIAFTGSEIGGDFMPQGAVLHGTPALQLRNTKIGGTMIWRGLGFVDGEVDLSGTSCKTLNTGNTSWLRKRDKYANRGEALLFDSADSEKKLIEYHTKLDNFTYEGFSNLPENCKSDYWIEWLKQQPDEHLGKKFKPRPWEQLAKVLDNMGYEEEARDVRIEKQKLQTEFMAKYEPAANDAFNIWHWGTILFRRVFWGPLVGYGYKPGNALLFLFGLILVGSLIYNQAARRGVITPTHPLVYKEARTGGSILAWCAENWVYFPDENCASAMPSEYSEFQSFVYAADVALPVINLRMENDWAPRVVYTDGTRDWFGWWVRTWEWFLIAAGWILSLLFVSAIGSSIRR
ncbi:MAG: hypothetical protein QNJ29_03590 [Rhizobiaceae bacterium]|nr:hypothetical protein [Rhizobiaceae bacterium]